MIVVVQHLMTSVLNSMSQKVQMAFPNPGTAASFGEHRSNWLKMVNQWSISIL